MKLRIKKVNVTGVHRKIQFWGGGGAYENKYIWDQICLKGGDLDRLQI